MEIDAIQAFDNRHKFVLINSHLSKIGAVSAPITLQAIADKWRVSMGRTMTQDSSIMSYRTDSTKIGGHITEKSRNHSAYLTPAYPDS